MNRRTFLAGMLAMCGVRHVPELPTTPLPPLDKSALTVLRPVWNHRAYVIRFEKIYTRRFSADVQFYPLYTEDRSQPEGIVT